MRLFISIDVPQEVQQVIKDLLETMQQKDLVKATFIKPEQAHMTLKFLGEVEEQQVPQIIEALQAIEHEPFEVQLGTLGTFSKKHKNEARVLWLELKGKEFEQLTQKIHQVLEPWFQKEERDFVGHLTLARIKKVFDQKKLLDELSKLSIPEISFPVNTFALKQSELTAEGPEHTEIVRFSLQ